ncbi:MAG: hypothetical protein DA330_01025 [Nitrososphaera sp.]|nr:hypothetical protein [Nitrososphaera sp.]
MSYSYSIYLPDETTLEIDFTYSPGHPGSFYNRHGDPGDPPEPAEVEILSATLAFGAYQFDVSDTRKWPSDLEQRVFEELEEEGEALLEESRS